MSHTHTHRLYVISLTWQNCFMWAGNMWDPKTSWPLKTGPIGCPETSVQNYHTTLRNTPEERRSHRHGSGTLKLRVFLLQKRVMSTCDSLIHNFLMHKPITMWRTTLNNITMVNGSIWEHFHNVTITKSNFTNSVQFRDIFSNRLRSEVMYRLRIFTIIHSLFITEVCPCL
jgi:hypothetical protein